MQNTPTPPKNEKPSYAGNVSDGGSLWQDLTGSRSGILLLGGGLFLILCNVIVFADIDFRPRVWLFYLDMRYWSVSIPLSIFLWAMVLWLASETTDFLEDYLPAIRMITAISVLLAIVFAFLSSFSAQGTGSTNTSLWFGAVLMIAVCCIVRSLFLLYSYRYEGDESIDLEEAQCFWGLSGFLLVGLILLGLMSIIHIKEAALPGMDSVASISLLQSCWDGLHTLIQHGQGSFALKLFILTVFIVFVAFVYVAGKWALVFLSKMRGE